MVGLIFMLYLIQTHKPVPLLIEYHSHIIQNSWSVDILGCPYSREKKRKKWPTYSLESPFISRILLFPYSLPNYAIIMEHPVAQRSFINANLFLFYHLTFSVIFFPYFIFLISSEIYFKQKHRIRIYIRRETRAEQLDCWLLVAMPNSSDT